MTSAPTDWSPKGLILLEGSDGTGKTTLAKYFVEHHGAHYMHLTYRFKDKMWTYHAAALHRACKLSQTRLVVLDRQWVSEGIYANVFRDGSKWLHGGRMFDRVIQKHAGVYIFCLAKTLDSYAQRYAELKGRRFEMYDNTVDVAAQYNAIYYGKPELIHHAGYVYDCAKNQPFVERDDAFGYTIEDNGHDQANFAKEVLDTLYIHRSTQYRRALSLDNYNVLGHAATSKYIVVGDTINKTNRVIDYPWYAHRNSSLFLAQVWSNLGLRETDFMYVNVNDPFGVTFTFELIHQLNKIPIVLGANALKLIPKREELIYLPHPSYGRRFVGFDDYCKILEPQLRAF